MVYISKSDWGVKREFCPPVEIFIYIGISDLKWGDHYTHFSCEKPEGFRKSKVAKSD